MRRKGYEPGRVSLHQAPAQPLDGFKRDQRRGQKFRRGNLPLVIMAVALLVLFFFSLGLLVNVTPEHRHLAYILELSQQKLRHLFNFMTGRSTEGGIQFIFYRYVMIVLAGAALAASGAVYNGAFRNILASPSTLGVQSGGTLGNLLYALMFVPAGFHAIRYSESVGVADSFTLLDRNLQQIMVLAGCFLAVLIVAGISALAGHGKIRAMYLIPVGMIFSSLISAFTGLVQYYLIELDPYDPRIELIRTLTMGSFNRAYTLEHLGMMCAFLLPCIAILLLLAGRLDVLTLGEEQAMTKGLPVRLFFFLIILVNTVMTASILAFCGQIGFIGFMVPQAARRLVGPGFRRLLPASMLMGSILLLLVYDIAFLFYFTDYINMLTSGLGCVVMIAMLLWGKGVRHVG